MRFPAAQVPPWRGLLTYPLPLRACGRLTDRSRKFWAPGNGCASDWRAAASGAAASGAWRGAELPSVAGLPASEHVRLESGAGASVRPPGPHRPTPCLVRGLCSERRWLPRCPLPPLPEAQTWAQLPRARRAKKPLPSMAELRGQ